MKPLETVVYVTIPVAVEYADASIDPVYMALRAIGEALPHSIERRQYKTDKLLATMHISIPYIAETL